MIELDDRMLQQLHKIELEMLLEVDRICRKYHIQYTIIGGTLLGAVRHGGFIPWDDDADVAMLRPEYNKFCKVCKKELDTERFYLQNMENTNGYRWGYAKLRRKNTVFLREHQEHMPYRQGIFLDIFPIDATPDNFCLRLLHDFRCFCVRKILWSAVGRHAAKNKIQKVIYNILYQIPERTIKRWYRGLILKRNQTTKVVRTLTYPAPKPLKGYYRKWFAQVAPISFEGYTLSGVRDYNGWLTYEFGDYMQMPPKDKQKAHPVTDIKLIKVMLDQEKGNG